ncbi:MAG: hypothetical protein SGILL_008360 [Bacillariaceae sp.]
MAKSRGRHKASRKKGERPLSSPKDRHTQNRKKAPRPTLGDSDADSESEANRDLRSRQLSRPPRYPTTSLQRSEYTVYRKESSQSEQEFEWQEEGSGTSHKSREMIGFDGNRSGQSIDSYDDGSRVRKKKNALSRQRSRGSAKRQYSKYDVSSLESDDEAYRTKRAQRARKSTMVDGNQDYGRRTAGMKRKIASRTSDEIGIPSVVDLTTEESAAASRGGQASAQHPLPRSAKKRRRAHGLPPTSGNYQAMAKTNATKICRRAVGHNRRLDVDSNVPNRFDLSSSSDEDDEAQAARKQQPRHTGSRKPTDKRSKKPSVQKAGRLKASESESIFDFDSYDENDTGLGFPTRNRSMGVRS